VRAGIAHGTVTGIHGEAQIGVTTLRRDGETSGRHATVAFSADPAEDAARRDFTMNALYCDRHGTLVDPLGALPDVQARRLRFVGKADDRVQEDFLRILRFFRFHAWYADHTAGIDPDGLAACGAHAASLQTISAERIGAEIRKLLKAPDPAPAVAAMHSAGVLTTILPGADPTPLAPLLHFVSHADPILRLAAIGGVDVAARLRLSKHERRRLAQLSDAAAGAHSPAELGYRLGETDGAGALALRSALLGQALPPMDDVARGARAAFPIRAADLPGDLVGAAIGARLRELEEAWIASDFSASKADLLA